MEAEVGWNNAQYLCQALNYWRKWAKVEKQYRADRQHYFTHRIKYNNLRFIYPVFAICNLT